ncbi:EAL domain-containing protein [Castellaniella sp.]|uniref:bifunctional diguanylate cyclase/phosphodiesterase n=1 Tax=Castellaniella sp. TaxID=1955812 RepID=UPI00355CE683
MQIHPSHDPEARRALAISLILLVALLLSASINLSNWFSGVLSLPWHMTFEVLSVSISLMIYGLVCSVRRERPALNLILLASLFLGVGLFDLLHMLSLQGMPDFVTPGNSNKGIYFWLLGRFFGVVALLCVAFVPWRITGSARVLFGCSALVLALVGLSAWLYFQDPQLLPRFFVPGRGLTPFKVSAEYALMALYGLAALRLFFHLLRPRGFNASGLFAAAFIMMQSEYFFTRYTDVSDAWMFIGHVYKVLAFLFLYYAIFVETVLHPYADLRRSRSEMLATLRALPDWVLELDDTGNCLQFYQHEGQPGLPVRPDGTLVRSISELLSREDGESVRSALKEAQAHGVSRGRVVKALGGEQERSFELSVAPRSDAPSGARRFIVIARDVTRRLRDETVLATLRRGIMQSPLPFVVIDMHFRIQLCNAAYAGFFGLAPHALLGKNPLRLLESRTAPEVWTGLESAIRQGFHWAGELTFLFPDHNERILDTKVFPIRNSAGVASGYMAHLEDVTEKRRAAERIRELSLYDQLTGLPNRRLMRERFQGSVRSHAHLALFWIDLDQFKGVNDTLGHETGDHLLVAVARRLHAGLQGRDMLVRVSGDDFLMLLHGVGQEEALARAQLLQKAMNQPIEVVGQSVSVTLSIGIALCPEDANEFDVLLAQAEAAVNRVKQEGYNHISFFRAEMQLRSERQLALGTALCNAIARGELSLVYQPVIALADGRVVGAEALLRWESEWGNVPPDEFIPIAEATGLIVSIGHWVLQTAVRQLARWHAAGLDDLSVAINFSVVQFQQGEFPQWVREILAETGVPPECVAIELTEAAAMRTTEFVTRQVDALSALGVQLAIDDFGTGYSSLSYLKQLHFHILKVDRSFVQNLEVDADDKVIAGTIIRMAQSLGMLTIAEGVGNATQLAFMQAHGCDMVQGFHFSPPLKPEAFERFVRHGHIPKSPA